MDRSSPSTWKFADARASHTFSGDTVDAVRMQHTPQSSSDRSIRRWTSWPQVGRSQWVEIDLKQAAPIQRISVWFYDDQGGVQVPACWWAEAWLEGKWQRIEPYNTDTYSVLPDTYNSIQASEPSVTDRIRLQLIPQHDQTCVGILSVDIEAAHY